MSGFSFSFSLPEGPLYHHGTKLIDFGPSYDFELPQLGVATRMKIIIELTSRRTFNKKMTSSNITVPFYRRRRIV